MTPEHSTPKPPDPVYADRVYRSLAGLAGGVLLLALALWLGIDALVSGHGNTPWLALAGLLFVLPLVIAFTLRPAVYANDDRLRIRNPFRSITLPWACVDDIRAAYSTEAFAGGSKYQLWAVPVSLRRRKRANIQQMRASTPGAQQRQNRNPFAQGADTDQGRAPSDQTVVELRELSERGSGRPTAQGSPEVRWAYEIMAPCVAGAVLLAVLLAVG
ncbi:PH domain-containing protein [Streptomyces sp. NBC_01089]|uniref:PH domain-containing protein n=1 Tax=Streptomyces sp. NBC_01089 TaxID=2903747 RepID=UPI003863441F|nr:PH domain-containing protein [Streptomyces sp. NBC_01089]